ncbi:16713_t:CDS:2, partial [Gigaspora margarita]
KVWFNTYEKSYRWLWAQLKGNGSLEKECFDIVKSFIKEYHSVGDDVEMDFQEPYGIARIEIISTKNLRQADSWLAANASDSYVKISNLATSWVYGDSRIIYNNCDPVWEQVFYIPVYDVHEKFNLQVFDYNAFFKHKLFGFYILDLKNIIKELPNGSNRGQLSFVADFFSLPESEEGEILNLNNVSIRHLYLSKPIWLACYILPRSIIVERSEWVNIYNRAESWLSENAIDVEVGECLYNYANKFVIKHFNVTQWVDENQQRSLGLLVISKRTIITRQNVDTRIVRRFLTYQNESDCFELTPQLAEALGFSSVEEAKKHIESHFSSYSPRTGQLNANVWSTAIMLWFIRYVLVDFRNDWVNEYQKAHDWIRQQVLDDKIREELLEAARNFVVKRFEVQDDAINEDESFKESIEVIDRFQSQGQGILVIVDEPDPEEEAPIPNDEVVGIIRILVKDAKNLKKFDSWFTFSNPDPYIRIVDSTGNEIVRTQTNHGTINPKWNEVHLIPAQGLGENISFEIYDENLFITDRPLGTCVLDTNILLKSEDQSKPIVGQFPLQIGKKPVRGHLNLEVQFFATGFNEARFFNYKSVDELKENFLAHLSSDKDLLKYDLSVLATVLAIMYLKILCWEHYGEWKRIIANSETWLSKEINNVDAEDRLYRLCKTFIIERFKVNNLEKAQLEMIEPAKFTIINRKIITIQHVRTLLSHQTDDGCIILNEKVAEYFGFKNVDECSQHLRKHFKTERVSKLHQNAWVTACIVWYLRLVAVDHRHEWIANYEKSSEWLKKQCNGDAALEKEINECARRFVVPRYEVDQDAIEADNSFIAAIKTKDAAIEEEKGNMHRKIISLSGTVVNRSITTEPIVTKFLTYRTNNGCYQLNDEIAKHLGFLDKASLEAALHSHFISDNLSKLDNDTLFTAVATWYLRLVAVDYCPHLATDCDTSYTWLSSQIKNPQIERELLESAKKFVVRDYNVDYDALEKDEEYQDHLNRTSDVESVKTIVIDNSDKLFAEKL